MVISLWSGPRSMSTALMYSFAQRQDTRVLDEPLYAHFLLHTGAKRPCREATLAARPSEAQAALKFMAPKPEEERGNRVLFCKHIANHTLGMPWPAFQSHRHVILFRNPAAVMASYGAHIKQPMMRDLCYHHQVDLVQRMEAEGNPPVVVCSDCLQEAPEQTLKALCAQLELSWDASIMEWMPGPRPEDGPWSPWWYNGVHASSGWEARPPSKHTVPEHLTDLYQDCLGAYEQLLKRAI